MQGYGLIKEKRLSQVAEVLVFAPELMHQIGVFEIDFINFPQGARATRFAPQMSNHSDFFHV